MLFYLSKVGVVKNILWELYKKGRAFRLKYLIVFFLSSSALFSQGVGEVFTWGTAPMEETVLQYLIV